MKIKIERALFSSSSKDTLTREIRKSYNFLSYGVVVSTHCMFLYKETNPWILSEFYLGHTLFLALTSAPLSTRVVTILTCPLRAAIVRGVTKSCVQQKEDHIMIQSKNLLTDTTNVPHMQNNCFPCQIWFVYLTVVTIVYIDKDCDHRSIVNQ